MKSKMCYICLYSEEEDKEYYLIELNHNPAIMAGFNGYVWGNKKDALIFISKNVAKSYLKDLGTSAYIKLVDYEG